jgi:hypothetical protein
MPMFYVEHMKNYKLSLILIILTGLLMQSCKEKTDLNPELKDPVYLDLKSELDISIKQEQSLIAQLAKDTLQFNNTVPQKGKSALHRNKMSSSENLLTTTQQQKKFFEIRIEQRKIFVQQRYLESLKPGGTLWPDEKELADYKIRMKLQKDKFKWETQNVPRGTPDKSDKKESTSEAQKIEAPKDH